MIEEIVIVKYATFVLLVIYRNLYIQIKVEKIKFCFDFNCIRL